MSHRQLIREFSMVAKVVYLAVGFVCAAALIGCAESGEQGAGTAGAQVEALEKGPFTRLWQGPAGSGSGHEPLFVHGGNLYVHRGDSEGTLRKIDVANGREAWVVKTEPMVGYAGVVSNGHVVAYGTLKPSNSLVGRDDATGKELWTVPVTGEIYGCGCFADGLFVIGTMEGEVIGVTWADGVVKWRTKLGGPVHARPVAYKGWVVAACEDGWVYALNTESGNVEWKVDHGGRIERDPVLVGDRLYVAVTTQKMGDSWRSDGTKYMDALDLKEKKVAFRHVARGDWREDVLAGNGLVYLMDGSRLMAFDAKYGDRVWEYEGVWGAHYPLAVKSGDQLLMPFIGELDVYEPEEMGMRTGWIALSAAEGSVVRKQPGEGIKGMPWNLGRWNDVVVLRANGRLEAWRISPAKVDVARLMEGSELGAKMGEKEAWSQEVSALRGRVSVRRQARRGDGLSLGVWVTLQRPEYTMTGWVTKFEYPRAWMMARVMDSDGRPLERRERMSSSSAFMAEAQSLILPPASELAFKLANGGVGVDRDGKTVLDLGRLGLWVIPDMKTRYYVQLTMGVAERERNVKEDVGGLSPWHGRFDFPVVEVPIKVEAMTKEARGRWIAEIGPRVLAKESEVAEEAAKELSLIDDERTVAWWVKGMDGPHVEVKVIGLGVLGEMPGDDALEGIKKGMTPKVEEGEEYYAERIRGEAAEALGRSRNPKAKALLRTMREDPSVHVRSEVIRVLGANGEPGAKEFLAMMLKSPDAQVRGETIQMMFWLKAEGTKEAAQRMQQDPDDEVRSKAQWVLEAMEQESKDGK